MSDLTLLINRFSAETFVFHCCFSWYDIYNHSIPTAKMFSKACSDPKWRTINNSIWTSISEITVTYGRRRFPQRGPFLKSVTVSADIAEASAVSSNQ